jgi:hypothetical protein
MKVSKVNAKIGLPFGVGEIGGEWIPGDSEKEAAWEMYIELITRVGVVELAPGEGLLREALSSLYSMFETTREILRRYGPAVAQPEPGSTVSFGHLAVAVLNNALRPVLSSWHPALEDHENARPDDVSRLEWEKQWDRHDELRSALGEVGKTLRAYAGLLGEVCDAKNLLTLTDSTNPQ